MARRRFGVSEDERRELEELLEFASPQQAAVVQCKLEHECSWEEVASRLGLSRTTPWLYFKNLRQKAARRGKAEMHDWDKPVPDGFVAKGVSTLYDHAGNKRAQWVKAHMDHSRQMEIFKESLETILSSVKPLKPTRGRAIKNVDESLLAQILITDFHVGALCWDLETGENWDTDIAKQVFVNAMADAIEAAPPAGVGILAQLGDFLHYDSLVATTPTSGHILDSDSRYQLLVSTAIELNVSAIDLMRKKFPKVRVVQAEGNHDMAGSIWLRKAIGKLYENDPSVVVDDTEFPFYAHLHGETMLAYHHGHKVKLKDLPGVFSSEPRFRRLWGMAKYTYIHTGHYHHEVALEDAGALVRQAGSKADGVRRQG